MPIYEFQCPDCNVLFSFFSRSVNTEARPVCPRCGRRKLEREVSAFATGRRGRESGADAGGEEGDLPIDEARMERAVSELASEAEGIDEDNPRQAAALMRKFSRMTGMEYGAGMEEALSRMEAGEDPEAVESEMGSLMDEEEPFAMPGPKGAGRRGRRRSPERDPKLYEL
jgi:putative FmdB family regulatory protein